MRAAAVNVQAKLAAGFKKDPSALPLRLANVSLDLRTLLEDNENMEP